MSRPTIDVYMMGMAMMAASRASCARRQVGCVLTNKLNNIIATGYNGPPRGMVNCTTVACPGALLASGTGLDACQATHAEQNALLQCKDVEQIESAYITASPCITCTKLLLNTACQNIIFIEPYPHNDSERMWTNMGRSWHMMDSVQVIELAELFRVQSERSQRALNDTLST